MAKKKVTDAFSYTKRYYGMSAKTKIDYSEAEALVGAVYPKKDVKAMLTVPNTIQCERCVVEVFKEEAVKEEEPEL